MKVLFAADLHGNKNQYASAIDAAIKESADALIIGGDIAPKYHNGGVDIWKQRDFLDDKLPRIFGRSKVPVYIIMGNDDAACNIDVLKKYHGKLWYSLHGKRLSISEDHEIVGYPFVPVTPFDLKDFEKFDTAKDPAALPGVLLEGYESSLNGWSKTKLDAGKGTIERDMQSHLFQKDPSKTIYVFHAPPYGTPLDMLYSREHVGSRAIRDFILTHNPLVVLSGHIHETVDVSGEFSCLLGNTLCAAPGNHFDSRSLSYLVFDLEDPKNSMERKVVGCQYA